MVKVALWGNLRPFADGNETVEVEATTVGQMLDRLETAYPGLAPHIEAGVSVSVDGRVIASSLTEPVKEDSEVVLLPRLKGG
ncbi:MAG: MoaD/ThiS family protein [Pikeienuella sp.]